MSYSSTPPTLWMVPSHTTSTSATGVMTDAWRATSSNDLGTSPVVVGGSNINNGAASLLPRPAARYASPVFLREAGAQGNAASTSPHFVDPAYCTAIGSYGIQATHLGAPSGVPSPPTLSGAAAANEATANTIIQLRGLPFHATYADVHNFISGVVPYRQLDVGVLSSGECSGNSFVELYGTHGEAELRRLDKTVFPVASDWALPLERRPPSRYVEILPSDGARRTQILASDARTSRERLLWQRRVRLSSNSTAIAPTVAASSAACAGIFVGPSSGSTGASWLPLPTAAPLPEGLRGPPEMPPPQRSIQLLYAVSSPALHAMTATTTINNIGSRPARAISPAAIRVPFQQPISSGPPPRPHPQQQQPPPQQQPIVMVQPPPPRGDAQFTDWSPPHATMSRPPFSSSLPPPPGNYYWLPSPSQSSVTPEYYFLRPQHP